MSPTLNAFNVQELLNLDIPPREMIVSPILPKQGLVMIHAPRGIGKTHVSLTLAYTVATGSEMFQGKWRGERPHKVLFVDGEMPCSVMQERLSQIVISDSHEVSPDNFKLITPDLQERGISDLSTPKGQQVIEEHLGDMDLLILDNYSALCRRGRENEAESWVPMQEWLLQLRRRNLSVLLIHHSNKQGYQRGTFRKEDLLDTVITFRKPQDYKPQQGARFEVHYEKARHFHGEDAEPFEAWLGKDEGRLHWTIQDVHENPLSQIRALQKEGLSQREMARLTDLSAATVNRRLKEAIEPSCF